SECSNLVGATLHIGYAGHDANGNPFRAEMGSAKALLAWPTWPTYTPGPTATLRPTRTATPVA
ncbi:MAG: hypothetical protein GX557_00380, partial [Chloroflexi bacterium]|nr:hypothetical protein [Chloroflexota bacterium]